MTKVIVKRIPVIRIERVYLAFCRLKSAADTSKVIIEPVYSEDPRIASAFGVYH